MSEPAHKIESKDDHSLVQRILNGDERAFHSLFNKYSGYLASVVYRLAGHDRDLDDIIQETFIAAHGGLESLRDPEQLKLWLMRIAVRKTTQHISHRSKRFVLPRIEPSVTGSSPATAEIRDELRRALSRVAPRHRVPWLLHHIEGFTLEETADICGKSLATTKRRIALARNKLARRFHDE